MGNSDIGKLSVVICAYTTDRWADLIRSVDAAERELTDDDVYESFAQAIEAREEAGETLDNRLIRIEDATVRSAELDGSTARIAVLFVADIAAVTRDADGTVVAGSLDDAIESRDVWTFRRNVGAADPNWVLDETDEG